MQRKLAACVITQPVPEDALKTKQNPLDSVVFQDLVQFPPIMGMLLE